MLFACLIGAFALSGCGDKGGKPDDVNVSKTPPEKLTPAEKLYEQLHSGIFQINAGLDAIEDAFKAAKAGPASTVDLKQSLEDIEASIDAAGDSLAEEAAEEPDRYVVAKDLAAADKRRRKLIDLTNDALHDLRDARGIVDSLADDKEVGPLEDVGVKIDVAMDGLRGALQQLGGTEEIEE
jgi:hypothetical protein